MCCFFVWSWYCNWSVGRQLCGVALSWLAFVSKDRVQLLGHPNEGRSFREFLQLTGSNISDFKQLNDSKNAFILRASRSNSSENVSNRVVQVASVRNLDCFALRSSVVRHAARVLFHRRGRRHSIEELELFAIFFNNVSAWLVMSGEHASGHYKVGASARKPLRRRKRSLFYPKALAKSPGQVHPPSEMIWPPRPCAASAHSRTAESCGYPTPVFFRVVQTEPETIS